MRRRLDLLPTVVAIAVIALGAVQLVDGALSAGIAPDERVHVERLYGWLAHDWYVPEYDLVGDVPNPSNAQSSPFVYGPAYSGLAHLANVELDNEPIGNVSFSQDAYDVRHLLVALLAALAVAATGLAVRTLTGSWRFGLWAAAGLLAIPSWLGHGFFNPKDIPVASGYTFATVALVLALAPEPPGGRRRAAVVILMASGIFFCFGTRLAMWPAMLAALLTYAVLRAGQRLRGETGTSTRQGWAVLWGVAIGVAAVAVAYPRVVGMPRTLLTHSISSSADYPTNALTLTAGHLLTAHPPWWYLPAWIGGRLPLLIGAFAIAGACVAVLTLIRLRERGAGSPWRNRQIGLVLVLQQAAMLPLLAIASNATMYDAARQHLYVFPALAILAGVGAHGLWRWAQAGGRGRLGLAAVTLSLALAVPMAEQSILFPYNYTYVNPIAGIGGVNGRWETDYWYTSDRESLRRVPAQARLFCSQRLALPEQPRRDPELDECRDQPFDGERGRDADDDRQGIWVLAWHRGTNQPPPWCEEADDVTRWLRGEDVVMGYVLRCDAGQVKRILRREEAKSPPS